MLLLFLLLLFLLVLFFFFSMLLSSVLCPFLHNYTRVYPMRALWVSFTQTFNSWCFLCKCEILQKFMKSLFSEFHYVFSEFYNEIMHFFNRFQNILCPKIVLNEYSAKIHYSQVSLKICNDFSFCLLLLFFSISLLEWIWILI